MVREGFGHLSVDAFELDVAYVESWPPDVESSLSTR